MILDRVHPALMPDHAPRLDSLHALLGRVRALWAAASAVRSASAIRSAPAGRPAYWEGFTAHQDGRDRGDNPHRAGSPKARAWLLGWQKGLED